MKSYETVHPISKVKLTAINVLCEINPLLNALSKRLADFNSKDFKHVYLEGKVDKGYRFNALIVSNNNNNDTISFLFEQTCDDSIVTFRAVEVVNTLEVNRIKTELNISDDIVTQINQVLTQGFKPLDETIYNSPNGQGFVIGVNGSKYGALPYNTFTNDKEGIKYGYFYDYSYMCWVKEIL